MDNRRISPEMGLRIAIETALAKDPSILGVFYRAKADGYEHWQRIGTGDKGLVRRVPITGHMKAGTALTGSDLGDRLGDVLADRFLYHFVVRRLAQQLLGEDDEWDGLPIRRDR